MYGYKSTMQKFNMNKNKNAPDTGILLNNSLYLNT